jgi:hypothetical protein
MKMMFTLLLIVAAVTVSAQTNFDVLVCKNASYINATIMRATPSYLVVSHNDGISKVALTNLPFSLQQRYHYDPTNAAAAIAAEEKHRLDVIKARAEQAKYLASLRGTNQVIQVKSVLDSFGQCDTSAGRIYITGLPSSVSGYLAQYYQLKAAIADNQVRAENMARAADRADANAAVGASGDAAYVNAVMAKRQQANNMIQNANEAAENLSKMKSNLTEMKMGLIQNTTVVAFPTGQKSNGMDQWQCVGVAQ